MNSLIKQIIVAAIVGAVLGILIKPLWLACLVSAIVCYNIPNFIK